MSCRRGDPYEEHNLAPPFSSDECPNSAEDSDEDVITDYLAPSSPTATSTGTAATVPVAHWEGIMAHQQQGGGGPLVPIISVTPHSPGSKHYPILEENLQQLHDIHESIQQMRERSAQAFNHQMLRLNQYSRLSASCPSLNNDPHGESEIAGSNASSPTQMHGSLCSSTHTTPQAGAPQSFRANSKELLMTRGNEDPKRRRSWTTLGDGTNGKEKHKYERQRSSMSLSSMDSDQDDPFLDQSESGGVFLATTDGSLLSSSAGKVKQRRYSGTSSPVSCATWNSGGASTHSLNEADLQGDFNKIVVKRETENLRLLPARLPLQKSVSTPSIIAVRDIVTDVIGASIPIAVENTEPLHATLQNLIDGHSGQRPSGTESETEEELAVTSYHHQSRNPAKRYPYPPRNHLSYDEFLTDNTTYDPHEGKRRKRGSIFFRKKKDKTKKVIHQWVSLSCGSPQVCDYCAKVLTNKPALYCETCAVTVHQNSCKDHILECNKQKSFKGNLSKGAIGPGSMQNSKQQSKQAGSKASNQALSSSGSQMISEEKEGDHHHHHHHGYHDNLSDDVPATMHLEFLDESPITAHDLETDPFLGLQDEEPDSWTPTVGKEVTKKLKEKEIKRQEHIYEFILTEKHHCLTLRVMQKVFVDGLQKYFQMGHNLDRMFPRLADLTDIHLGFLHKLREKQKTSAPTIDSIADILLEQFSGLEAERLKSAYGEFCSRHRDAVDLYKDYLQQDHRFGEFVRHCQTNPLLKKKGIPECVLFVTQRLTKYPLLIEPLIKSAKENKKEQEKLSKALALVKEILVAVDAQVAEKEKEDRKLEIYNRIDAKSFTTHRNKKFKKSDILSNNRRLRFEGLATLMQGRSKMQLVLVIVLSDVLFFLQENNNKYTFFTPDNKAGVVSLQKLLVREKAGQESRGIYLISSNPSDPEMFELKVHKPKDKLSWINAVRQAVERCPEEEEEAQALSMEEKQRLLEAKRTQIQQIVGVLRKKDMEQAQILEDKMALQLQLLAAAGLTNLPEPPSYTHLVAEDADSCSMWKEVLSAFHEVNQLASSLYASGTNLSRSVSSVGEHQSEAYVSPTLPKRAETFGGFDNANKELLQACINKALSKKQPASKEEQINSSTLHGSPDSSVDKGQSSSPKPPAVPWRSALLATVPTGVLGSPNLGDSGSCDVPHLLTLGQEQQLAAVKLSHYVYTLLCIISQQMTTIDSLQASLSSCKQRLRQDDGGKDRKPVYKHNQQLEELRNLQDRLTHEKEAWNRDRENEEKDIEERRVELLRLQEQVRTEQADIIQQREQLYRRMEMLTSQGILISPNMPVVTCGQDESQQDQTATRTLTTPSPPAETRRKLENKWKASTSGGSTPTNAPGTNSGTGKVPLPINLISATNQQKAVAQSVQVKQQLPLKLAKLASGSGTVTGPSREGVTQMLPLKLSQMESLANKRGGGDKANLQVGSYQRLSSNSFSPNSVARDESGGSSGAGMPTHVRTGSSPAMMQPNTSPAQQSTDKTRSPPEAKEEEVIFF